MAFFQRNRRSRQGDGWQLILHLDATDLVEFEALFSASPRLRLTTCIEPQWRRVNAKDGLDQQPS